VHGRILLLNGPPSSGKTTLARAIQAAAEQPLWHQSLDDFRAGYSKRFWRVDDGSLFALAMYAYLRALRSIAEAGVDLVAESVITPTRRSMYLGVFDGFSVTFVGVRCTLPVAQAREHARNDRLRGPVDLDVPEFEQVHQHPYDLEVDTTFTSPEGAAQQVLEAFKAQRQPRAFDAMRDRNS